ncbi:MAG: HutD family protein [Rubrivivax sp.]|nr:HutD family protein [Rubrivivax sp.]
MIVQADGVVPTPWRNGGGRTRELLRWPAEGDWRLRLSLADIAADGPFSPFPGVARWFVVVQGDGVALRFGDGDRQLRAGDAPLRFDGAQAPGCRLLGGATRDLNLMLRGLDGELAIAHAGQTWAAAWPMRGFFEAGTHQLHWPCAADRAPADGWWIGAAA